MQTRPFVTLRNKLIVQSEDFVRVRLTPRWWATPCWLSATSYAVPFQLPSISGSRLLNKLHVQGYAKASVDSIVGLNCVCVCACV